MSTQLECLMGLSTQLECLKGISTQFECYGEWSYYEQFYCLYCMFGFKVFKDCQLNWNNQRDAIELSTCF